MILQMANPLSGLFRPKATCWRSVSLRNNWSTISQSVFSSPRKSVDDGKPPFLGIRSLHVGIRCGIGNNIIRPYCQPLRQHNWPFFSSRTTSQVCNKKLDINEDEVTVDCQQGKEKLKDFLTLAESRGMQVSSKELVKAVDEVIAAIYSNGKYPFMVHYDVFQDQSATGKMGLTGSTGVLQLFREQSLLKDFITCPEIEPLLSLIDANLLAMTASDKAHLYFCLHYLGIHEIHTNHPVMHKLFYTLTEPAGKLNYEDLLKFGRVLETFCHPDVVRYQFFLPHFRHLNSVGILTGLEKQQFVRAISSTGKLYSRMPVSYHGQVKFSQIWHALVTDENIMKCPENIVNILSHCSYHGHKQMVPHILKKDFTERIENAFLQHMDDLDIRTLGKIAKSIRYLEMSGYVFSKKLQLSILDRLEKILHNRDNISNMSTVELISVMEFYGMGAHDFCLSQDSLAILIPHMEKKFPELQPIYSVHFMRSLSAMIRKHRKDDNLSHFDRLLTLMDTHSGAKMFMSHYLFEKLLMEWRICCLSTETFKTYVQLNVILKKGFGRDRRWLPIALDYIENKLDDDGLKRDLMKRILSACEGEIHIKKLLLICFNLIDVQGYKIDSCQHTEFYKEILQLINRKLTDLTDLKEVADCFSSRLDFKIFERQSVLMKDTVINLVESVSKGILLPHQRKDAISLARHINHHFYNQSYDFFYITTPAVDQLVANMLDGEQTCDLDCFVTLTKLIACGVMSTSRKQELEKFADVLFEENMDFMRIDSLLLGLDNLCLAGVFPPQTLSAILSSDFLEVVDQCISSKSHRVVSIEHIEYHLLRLNRSVFLDCPALDIPWFCGHIDVVQRMPEKKHLRKYCEMTENVLSSVLGGEQFLSVNSTTQFKHVVDFQCFISPHGHPVRPDRIDGDIPVPADIKKIAIDLLPDTLWDNKPDVMYQEKKRHLKKEGYKYIQVRRDCMRGLALSTKSRLGQFYIEKIFS